MRLRDLKISRPECIKGVVQVYKNILKYIKRIKISLVY